MVWLEGNGEIDGFIEATDADALRIYRNVEKKIAREDVKYMNDFLEHTLVTGDHLSWGSDEPYDMLLKSY